MSGFGALLGKELREQLRTYRLPVVAIVFLIFGITSPLLARYTKELLDLIGQQAAGGIEITIPPPTVADAVGQLIKNLGQFGILVAILLAMGSVATEKDRGTAALILAKPVSRLAFLAAKLMAIGFNLAVAVAIGCVFGAIYTALLFENANLTPVGWLAMAMLLWLSIVAYAALTFLGSTLARSAAAGAGVGFLALVITGVVAALPVVGGYMPLALQGAAVNLGAGLPVADDLVGAALVALLIIGASLGLAWLSFRRQEL
jgi:ABC-2 type transport system permease protein